MNFKINFKLDFFFFFSIFRAGRHGPLVHQKSLIVEEMVAKAREAEKQAIAR
jgi:hypothetical protein